MSPLPTAAFTYWTVDPMSTVQRLPDAEPTDGIQDGVIKIVSAKDAYEPASFVVRADGDCKAAVSAAEFVNENGVRFPQADIDIKVVKVWYQNRNAWFSYFGDCGKKLVPELLLNDENLIRVDEKTQSNYALLREADGSTHERWINPPRQFDTYTSHVSYRTFESFACMKPNFYDTDTLQEVTFLKGKYKQLFVTAHIRREIPAGTYRGSLRLGDKVLPAEIVVLPFTLPKPRAYADQSKEFKVSSYNYMGYLQLMARNGYDLEGARKLFDPVLRNLVAHNQDMYIGPANDFDEECRFTFEAFRKAGMRTDELMGFVGGDGNKSLGDPDDGLIKRRAAAATRYYGHRNIHITYGDEPPPSWLLPTRNIYNAYQDWGFKNYIAGGDMCFYKAGYLYNWYNVARQPTDGRAAQKWSEIGNESVGWYANQHVGAEDPSLNRRQNGLGAYLAGYTALCNYAHHFGNWNDDSTTYRPMVYAYGTGRGVVNTLQFEGFREGVDDVRYATVLVALAREASAKGDRKVWQLGRRALHYLATFDKVSGSLTACRAEMIRFIMELRAALGHEAVLPAVAKPEAREPEADITAELEEELAQAKGASGRAEVYAKYFLFDEAYNELAAGKLYGEAAVFAEGENMRRPDLAEQNLRKALQQPKTASAVFADLMPMMLAYDIPFALKYEREAFGGNDDEAKAFIGKLQANWVRPKKYIYDERFAAAAEIFRMIREGSAKLNEAVAYEVWRYGIESLLMKGDLKGAGAVAKEALKDIAAGDWKAAERYAMNLVALVADGRDIPYELGRDCLPKDRLNELYWVASAIMRAGDEQTVRKLDVYRGTLVKPRTVKRYTVEYSPRLLLSPEDWTKAGVVSVPMDRRYGGSTEVLYTDVTNDRGGEKAPAWMPQNKDKEDLQIPDMAIAADDWGLHFRFAVKDGHAPEIAAGLAGGDSWEGYIAAGKELAYSAILAKSDAKPSVNMYHTSYDGPTYRNPDRELHPDWSQIRTVFGDDKTITTFISLSWEMFALTLPKDGDVWDFENIRWARAGDNAWNGTESIHGRSTWGELVFRLPPEARRAILRRQIFAASLAYAGEKDPKRNGVLEFWNDPLQGDPAFYAACLKPIVERLDAYLPLVKVEMTDEEIDKVAAEALKDWLLIRQTVDAERAKYLMNR